MEENLEISKSKFFLSFSLSLRKEKGTQKLSLSFPSLSLFTFEVSLFRPKKVRFARTNREREREVMICSRRFVSLFKKCVSLVVGGVGFLKKWRIFHLNSRLKKKKKKKFQNLLNCPHETNTPAREEAQNTFLLLTRAALTTNTILILIL